MGTTFKVNNQGDGINEVLEETERLGRENGLSIKQQAQIRLLTEETMEMVKNISNAFEADVTAEIENGQFELRLRSKANMDSDRRDKLEEIVARTEESREVSGKIRAILQSRYYDDSETDNELFEQMGITRVEPGEVEGWAEESEYVWSLQNYGFKAFDRQLSESEDDADWAEIGRSIIANLSDDLRLYIFRDHLELIVTRRIGEEKDKQGDLNIDPQLLVLKKIPVATSRVQVRMVQLLYGGLMRKEKSDDLLSVQQIRIPSPSAVKGRLKSLVYVKKEKEEEVLPAVLFLHGGAFVFPALPYHYRLARYIAENTGCRVFMPDYDLAPDHKPLIQQSEAFEVYRHLTDNSEEYRIDPGRLAILGDSAGGTLCAALCLRLRNEGLPMPSGQLLLYPSLDARLESRSMKLYTDVPVCNATAVKAYYKLCSTKTPKKPREYISPAEAESLKGMPPTYVETAEFDCLHDDGILYADRLMKEHCDVVLNETRGTVHAFDMAKDSDVLKEALKRRVMFINDLFYV